MRHAFLVGATASGKGEVAFRLAGLTGAEIISLDSMKVFRGMDIGTGKPAAERRRAVRYHLLDIVDPWEPFSVGDYVRLALGAVADIEARGGRALLAGGTGLYLRALVEGIFEGPARDRSLHARLEEDLRRDGAPALWERLRREDPGAAARIHPHDARRILRALELVARTGRRLGELWRGSALRLPPGSYTIFGLALPRASLYRRIDRRAEAFFRAGLVEEVRGLASDPRGLGREASQAIGYREILEGLRSECAPEAMLEIVQRDTRRLAKRQLTWFRKFPVRWVAAARLSPGALAGRIAEAWLGRSRADPD